MRIVGIIGPYFSGGDRRLIDHNIANAQSVAIEIANHFGENRLVGFFAPHSHTARFEKLANAPEAYYHALDDAIYDGVCEAFVLLPNWAFSKGSIRDIERATEKNKPIFPLTTYHKEDLKRLLSILENWASNLS